MSTAQITVVGDMQVGLEVYIGIMAKSNLQSIFKKRSSTLVELTSESRDEEPAGLGEQPQVGSSGVVQKVSQSAEDFKHGDLS